MKKSMKFLALLLLSSATLVPSAVFAAPQAPKKAIPTSATTRSDAVIFKVHDVEPVLVEGVVTGCDYTVTLYNRTSINFRNFTINLDWEDPVDERFRFDRYAEAIMSQDEFNKYKEVIKEDNNKKPVSTSVTVNAFGADKQISVRSHIDSEKCYFALLCNKRLCGDVLAGCLSFNIYTDQDGFILLVPIEILMIAIFDHVLRLRRIINRILADGFAFVQSSLIAIPFDTIDSVIKFFFYIWMC